MSANMPPMPPMMPMLTKNKKSKEHKAKSTLPKSCEMIPPMIYRLPPPLENALKECKNDLAKPSKKDATKKFGVLVDKITALKEFNQLYKITFKVKKMKPLFCNSSLTYCFDKKPIKR